MKDETCPQITPRAIKYYVDRKITSHQEELGLNISCCYIILGIWKNDGISQKELSERLMVNKSLTTRTIRSLIEDGFVENDNNDVTHKYSLKLTDKGNEVAKKVSELLHDIWSYLMKDLTEEEKRAFSTARAKMLKAIEEDPINSGEMQ